LLLAGTALAAPPSVPLKTSFSADFSDIWWNRDQPGWGMQMVQTGNFVFATIYVYGPDGKPMWFGGGMTSTGGSVFTGKLYVTTGPYFGATFDPAGVNVREAGTMSFTAGDPDSGLLTYTVDGVSVTKSVQRQPLGKDDYNGVYGAVLTQTVTGCGDPTKNGAFSYAVGVQITQDANTMTIDIANPSGDSCRIIGAYSQLGRNGRVDGSYTCISGENTGDNGTATVTEMNNRVRQFSARMRRQSAEQNCLSTEFMTGLVPN